MPANDDTEFFTLEELAERWKVSVKWLRRRVWDKELAAVKIGKLVRVRSTEVQRFEGGFRAA
jgi:excisionase family DNA binding protein